MASVRERHWPSGAVTYAVLHRDRGKQTSKTFRTGKAAERFAKLVNATDWTTAVRMTNAVTTEDTDVPTVGEVVRAHIDALSGITAGTRSDYLSYSQDLGVLATIPVDALTETAVAKWINTLARRLAGKSIRNRQSLLSAALKRAQRDGLIADNPAEGAKIPRTVKREMTFLSHSEFAELLQGIPPYWHPLVVTLAGTAMRWGEATAVAVKDVDVDHSTIRVRQAWKHTDGHAPELGAPKAAKSRRTITLPPQVLAELLPLLKGRKPDDLVFVNHQGRRVHQSTFLVHVWQPAVKRIDKTPRVHDLRHTHVAWLIAANVPLPVIQARLGHESIQTTVDVYGHLSSDAHLMAANAASVALGPALPALEG